VPEEVVPEEVVPEEVVPEEVEGLPPVVPVFAEVPEPFDEPGVEDVNPLGNVDAGSDFEPPECPAPLTADPDAK